MKDDQLLLINNSNNKNYTCLCSLSGGLDTTVLAYHLKKKTKENPLFIHFKYGQKTERTELFFSQKTAAILQSDLLIINFPLYIKLIDSFIFDDNYRYEEGAQFWLEGRNVLFTIIMGIIASKYKITNIYNGSHKPIQDWNPIKEQETYPDETIECYASINQLFKNSFKNRELKIICPFNDWNYGSKEVTKLAENLSIPFCDTFTCCQQEFIPCRKCEPCNQRKIGFEQAGIIDPTTNY